MGFELHITRKEDAHDDAPALDISLSEWLAHVGNDPEFRLDNFAQISSTGRQAFDQIVTTARLRRKEWHLSDHRLVLLIVSRGTKSLGCLSSLFLYPIYTARSRRSRGR